MSNFLFGNQEVIFLNAAVMQDPRSFLLRPPLASSRAFGANLRSYPNCSYSTRTGSILWYLVQLVWYNAGSTLRPAAVVFLQFSLRRCGNSVLQYPHG